MLCWEDIGSPSFCSAHVGEKALRSPLAPLTHAEKAAEATSPLTNRIPLPETSQEAAPIGLLSPDSLELGLRFESTCGHPPSPLD